MYFYETGVAKGDGNSGSFTGIEKIKDPKEEDLLSPSRVMSLDVYASWANIRATAKRSFQNWKLIPECSLEKNKLLDLLFRIEQNNISLI